MILIADSGSTKTDWVLCPKTIDYKAKDMTCVRFKTQGINPFYQEKEEIVSILQNELFCKFSNEISDIDEVYFYGAGCTGDKAIVLELAIKESFTYPFMQNIDREINVATDLLGAARAACGKLSGLICIMGTGSNTGIYDGYKIVKNIPPLGFILGDEGSGAALGKLFLNALFKEKLSSKIKDVFLEETHQTYSEIIERVYSKTLPNRYLANISKFIAKYLYEFGLHDIVKQNFDAFFENNILRYEKSKDYNIAVVGSIGKVFENILRECAEKYGYNLTNVLAAPIDGLIKYHLDR